jgi:hypothetical protein
MMLRPLGLLALAALTAPSIAFAADAPTGKPASDAGTIILDARLRYEGVSQDGFGKDAQALTLRTRLGYETPAWHGFKALVEGENLVALTDDYNSTTNGKTTYPTVADPKATQMNRLQVSWTGAPGQVTVGRQRIILGNARFVGNVGFRQNEQTFDAARLDLKPAKGVTLTYVYLDKVHRVFGPDSTQGTWNGDGHLFQAEAALPAGQLTGYGYLLDFDNAPTQSSATWGARFAGAHPIGGGVSVTYEGEYARQSDYGNNPARFGLDYIDLGAGLKTKSRWASLGYERLDGNGARGFQTPLATLHTFQGWADVFLTTPAKGVRDLNLRAGAVWKPAFAPKGLKLQLAVHDFDSADGDVAYGREADGLISAPLNPHLTLEAKAAVFDGASPAFADRTKVWVTLEFKY